MTTSTPPPYPPGQPVYPTAYAVVVPKRPPLTRREKRGAAWAGILGFNLLGLGFLIFIIPVLIGMFGALFYWLIQVVARSLARPDGIDRGLPGFFDNLDFTPWILPAVLVSVLGLVVMAGAILLSRALLKGHGVHRPTAVTWAGAGVAIVAFWVVSWIPGFFVQIVPFVLDAVGVDGWANTGISGVITILVAIVTSGVLGWLAWWWMAHAMRRPAGAAAVTTTTTTTTVQE